MALQGVNPGAVTELAQNIVKTIKLMEGHIGTSIITKRSFLPPGALQNALEVPHDVGC
jgi:hypothetical protein